MQTSHKDAVKIAKITILNVHRVLSSTFIGCLSGLVSGIAFTVIFCFSAWLLYGYRTRTPWLEIAYLIVTTGVPLGIIVGTLTGSHHAIFRSYNPPLLDWSILIGLGFCTGLRLTGVPLDSANGVMGEVILIGMLSSIFPHRLTVGKKVAGIMRIRQFKVLLVSS
jgi:hypothetical protein